MAHLIELDGVRPTIGEDVFLAPTAVLIGNVHVGARSSVWFGAVLRGDLSRIEIGERCSIQDTAVIHCAIDLPTIIGDAVTVGHGALLEGCTIEDGAVIGMGADGAPARPRRRAHDDRRRRGRARADDRRARACWRRACR